MIAFYSIILKLYLFYQTQFELILVILKIWRVS